MMLARYLGNKSSILSPLMGMVREIAVPGDHVVDAFSGSLAVSLALKAEGFRVTANDINLFSSVFAEAYLLPHQLASPSVAELLSRAQRDALVPAARRRTETLRGQPGYTFLDSGQNRERYTDYLMLLEHLEAVLPADLPAKYRRTDFFDTYSEEGKKSAFVSARGTTGRRRFFSGENALRLDAALNQLRYWTDADVLDMQTRATLLAGLVRSVESVANTQGTFHDFIREGWDSRALGKLRLSPPALDSVVAGSSGHAGHRAGREQDTLDFIGDVDDHAVLYLDPPYNFRQYSAYYFLPNVICRYPLMEDPESYFDQVKFVRGQNPQDDFSSTFCKSSTFVRDLRTVVERARCRTVMISYFNGANHWGKFDSDNDDTGRSHLETLLSDDRLFVPGTLRVLEVPRRNYASYGGYTARSVTELVLVADKRQDDDHAAGRRPQRRLPSVA